MFLENSNLLKNMVGARHVAITDGKHLSNREKPFLTSFCDQQNHPLLSATVALPQTASLRATSVCSESSGFVVQVLFVLMKLLAAASLSFNILSHNK